jgi:MFS family permease
MRTSTLAIRIRIFAPFALGYFLSYLYRSINAVIGPDLVTAIGINAADLGLLTAAYLIAFAAFQLPLGLLLDRYGARRIEAALLVIAAAGAVLFARADSLGGVLVGRGLIGLGVSACLMAAFKAFVVWFPREQLARINGFQMAAGGLGAMVATTPVQMSLNHTDWRGVFLVLAVLTLVAAALVFLVVPEPRNHPTAERFGQQVRGIGTVASSLVFWRTAPLSVFSQAACLALQSLWAGPWLRDVAGLDRLRAADILMALAGAMVAGFIVLGALAEKLGRRGTGTSATALVCMTLFMGCFAVLIAQPRQGLVIIWAFFGFTGSSGILTYASLTQSFPAHLSGRVTTLLNLLVFMTAFVAQWGVGAIVNLWPATAAGGYNPEGYRVAFGVLLGLQALGLVWYWAMGKVVRERRERKAAESISK